MIDEEVLIEARHRLASQFYQPYHINAIIAGDWDTGELMRAKIAEVMASGSHSHTSKQIENCELQSA